MKYKWKLDIYQEDPNEIGRELERIEERDGNVTPEAILEEARDESSPLHSLFEWDDGEAAEKYRISQAKKVIRLLVAVTTVERREIETIAYVSSKPKPERAVYVNVRSAMSDERTRAVMLQNAIHELEAFRKKYEMYSELADLFREIDRLVEKRKDGRMW